MNTPASPTALTPPDVLQLAGHPVRWRLLGELAFSDRTVHELCALLGAPQNMVSYHLGKLRDAGVVAAQRSAADRRDAYYTLDLPRTGTLLAATGAALHPGLRLSLPTVPSPSAGPAQGARNAEATTRILFLCTGNSARSQMAEALARARSGGTVAAFSAGSVPKPIHPLALRVMREEHGIDMSAHAPKHLDEYAGQRFDWIVSLCDVVREHCPPFPGDPATVHWSTRNPAATEGDARARHRAFRQTANELEVRVGFLLARIAAPQGPT